MSSALISVSSWSARQVAVRSRSCGRASFVAGGVSALDPDFFEGVSSSSSEVGSLEVGFWNAIDRNRVDSILAEGTWDRMCRCNCLSRG